MSFTLKLGFAGQCLFVPELDTGRLVKMHVLLPEKKEAKEHEAWLISDALPRKADDAKSPRISLADRNIDLSSLYSPTLLEGVPAGGASLAPKPVPRDLLSDKDITSRVTFTAGRSHIHRCARS